MRVAAAVLGIVVALAWSPLAAPVAASPLHPVSLHTAVEVPVGLDSVTDLAVTPDGEDVYAVASVDSSISYFRRDPIGGALEYHGGLQDGDPVDGSPGEFVDGLAGAWRVAVSPDGRHVYVASIVDHAVAVFERLPGGNLQFVESEADGDATDLLTRPSEVVVSPDGRQVFVSARDDDALTVFDRDIATGELTYRTSFVDGVDGVDGLDRLEEIALSPDGRSVYVAGSDDGEVAVFGRDPETGTLAFVEAESDGGGFGLADAFSVAVSRDGLRVYAVATVPESLVVFDRDPDDGALSFRQLVHPSNGPAGFTGPGRVAVSGDGEHVFVGATGDDALWIFRRDPADLLVPVGVVRDADSGIDGLDGPTGMASSPLGEHLYVVSQEEKLAAFALPVLAFADVARDGVAGVDGLVGVSGLALDPQDASLYAACVESSTIVIFGRDGGDGTLDFVELEAEDAGGIDSLYGAFGVAVAPAGDQVLVTAISDSALSAFDRDADTHELEFVLALDDSTVEGMLDPNRLTVSDDGEHVYVANEGTDAIVVFQRAGDGTFAVVQALYDGLQGVEGLDGAFDVQLAPGGGHLYATGADGDTVAAFTRDGGTGELAFVAEYGSVALSGLDGPTGLAVSPDGRHLYVAARDAGALVAIARDPADGSLAYIERHDGSTPFTSGLTGAADVQVSPDGRWVYVCSAVDDALAVFARDRSSGELHVQQVLTDADAGVDGLDGCRELALTADGMHLYAAAADESAIGHFTFVRSTRIFANGFESASTAQWSSTAP